MKKAPSVLAEVTHKAPRDVGQMPAVAFWALMGLAMLTDNTTRRSKATIKAIAECARLKEFTTRRALVWLRTNKNSNGQPYVWAFEQPRGGRGQVHIITSLVAGIKTPFQDTIYEGETKYFYVDPQQPRQKGLVLLPSVEKPAKATKKVAALPVAVNDTPRPVVLTTPPPRRAAPAPPPPAPDVAEVYDPDDPAPDDSDADDLAVERAAAAERGAMRAIMEELNGGAPVASYAWDRAVATLQRAHVTPDEFRACWALAQSKWKDGIVSVASVVKNIDGLIGEARATLKKRERTAVRRIEAEQIMTTRPPMTEQDRELARKWDEQVRARRAQKSQVPVKT